jgi:hypothetical protein
MASCKVCLEHLRKDGTCKWACDPKLANPFKRTRPVGVKEVPADQRGATFSVAERQNMSNAVAKVDKTYASWSNEILARKNHGSR